MPCLFSLAGDPFASLEGVPCPSFLFGGPSLVFLSGPPIAMLEISSPFPSPQWGSMWFVLLLFSLASSPSPENLAKRIFFRKWVLCKNEIEAARLHSTSQDNRNWSGPFIGWCRDQFSPSPGTALLFKKKVFVGFSQLCPSLLTTKSCLGRRMATIAFIVLHL